MSFQNAKLRFTDEQPDNDESIYHIQKGHIGKKIVPFFLRSDVIDEPPKAKKVRSCPTDLIRREKTFFDCKSAQLVAL